MPDAAKPNKILEHAARYRVTDIDVVHAALADGGAREATRMALHRSVAKALLIRQELRGRSFFTLSAHGAALAGASRYAARPLGAQAMIERYTVACWCCLYGKTPLITPSEFASDLGVVGAGINPALQHYVLQETARGFTLTRLTVDFGGDAARFVRKVRDIQDAAAKSALREFIKDRAFAVTVLTAWEWKIKKLEAALAKDAPLIPVSVTVVPEMARLIGTGARATTR